MPGTEMAEPNTGWSYLSDSEATIAYSLCGITFALFMIPGGRVQDKYGARTGAVLGGLFLAAGCILAGLVKGNTGLLLGFGLLGGIGMGLGYASATPAAIRWFGTHRRGLVVGLVVGGYGGAVVYIAPLAEYLVKNHGLTASFVVLGVLFAAMVTLAGSLLFKPPLDYVAPKSLKATKTVDVAPRDILKTGRFVVLLFLLFGSSQSGLLVIGNAAPMMATTAKGIPFFAENAWLLAAFGGVVNALGRVGTGMYSDTIGRANAYALNGLIAMVALFATPAVMSAGNVWLLFLVVGIAFWQYGGGLALIPAATADAFGAKNMGTNYGLVFLGWGLAFLVPLLAGILKDQTGQLDAAFYSSAGILLACVVLSRKIK
jgi:OFA family oxalate/formate antiporter-like MFS transporter